MSALGDEAKGVVVSLTVGGGTLSRSGVVPHSNTSFSGIVVNLYASCVPFLHPFMVEMSLFIREEGNYVVKFDIPA